MMQLNVIQKIAIWIIPLLFAITLHEVAHGWVASFFGDKTAKLSGRLSVNPIHHIDLIGTIVIPMATLLLGGVIFGWAKPVPVDPRNLRHPKRDMAFVALAGPLANLVMAIAWAGIAKIGMMILDNGNQWLGLPLSYMGGAGVMVNVVLGVLNLIPLPPLDGSKMLASLLPGRAAYQFERIAPYSLLILLILLLTGALSYVLGPPIMFLVYWISQIFG